MKGILLAGGSGTRLYPLTSVVCKQLLPVYDKPMVYYPLTTLMLAGIRDILVITAPQDQELFKALLGDGEKWGIHLDYAIQQKPRGIAEAFIIGETYLAGDSCCLILGDNIFYRQGLTSILDRLTRDLSGARIVAYYMSDPRSYAVVAFDSHGQVTSLEEKPANPKTHYVVPGLYFVDGRASAYAKKVKPSHRNELEITDVLNQYRKDRELKVELLGRGAAWLDAGTPEMLVQASQFIQTIEERQGLKIACPEEIALHKGFISIQDFERLANESRKNSYGQYLLDVLRDRTELSPTAESDSIPH